METSEELARTFQTQKLLIESSIDGIIAGDKAGRIMIFNKSMEQMLGYARTEVIGEKMIDRLFCAGEADRFKSVLASAEYGGKGRLFVYESFFAGNDGSRIPVQFSAAMMTRGKVPRRIWKMPKDLVWMDCNRKSNGAGEMATKRWLRAGLFTLPIVSVALATFGAVALIKTGGIYKNWDRHDVPVLMDKLWLKGGSAFKTFEQYEMIQEEVRDILPVGVVIEIFDDYDRRLGVSITDYMKAKINSEIEYRHKWSGRRWLVLFIVPVILLVLNIGPIKRYYYQCYSKTIQNDKLNPAKGQDKLINFEERKNQRLSRLLKKGPLVG